MQKLFRRTSPSGPLLCYTAANPPLPLAFFSLKKPHFLSLTPPPMRTATAFAAANGSALAASLPNKPTAAATISSRLSSTNCHSCRCSIESKSRPLRAWVVFKDGRSVSGSRTAWLHTGSERSFAVEGLKNSKKGLGNSSSSSSVEDEGEEEGSFAVEGLKNSEKGLENSSNSSSVEDGGEEGEKDGREEGEKGLSEEKPLRLHRRQRGSWGGGGGGRGENPDLLTIPGVGPRNLRKLVEKGIGDVAELKQLYKDKFFGKASQKMVEFLQSSVGIIHKNHAESITTFIKESVDEDLKDSNSDVKPAPKKRLTFCVEGNISVGKTTFLQRIANETLELRDLVEVVPEPINKWQDVGPDHFNILDAFYAEPERYAYTFQNYVFVTRVMQERESSGGIKPLRLMERSVFSDRMVFVRAVHEANWMNEMEISIYDSWFDPVVSCLPGLIPDGFIYLRASPDTCHKRMKLRKRAEEGGVSLEYLHGLHEKHESWLFPFESGNHGVLSVSKLPLHMDSSLHPDIRDRVFYLEGDHMHSSIQKVPALVLDCEPNIDFSKDIEAKRQYARQVAEFFEFVKKKQEVPSTKAGGEGGISSQPQILLPHQGGLWAPGGRSFPESALKSLDFRRAMSLMSGQ